ncbi:hypothetical protein BJ138DRAFT_1182223 [Hygrophoropsis aurantiaca]|uniref:Uncharacterized protein n=1 Tax=Hygrophoropsis aurantiaca TaxID=72124 RepID=A0ACB8A2T3_9AGAM|nr:hypothetical protein BJ138DRAFT_1182223 [Hygrophoropsis aurantiaca]
MCAHEYLSSHRMFFRAIVVCLIATLLFTAALTNAKYCDADNLPAVGSHDYRLDVYDDLGCHKNKHHEWFYGTFHGEPFMDLSHCHTLAPALRGKARSFTLNQGVSWIPVVAMQTWSGPNCTGDILDYKLGNWIENNAKKDGLERIQSFSGDSVVHGFDTRASICSRTWPAGSGDVGVDMVRVKVRRGARAAVTVLWSCVEAEVYAWSMGYREIKP